MILGHVAVAAIAKQTFFAERNISFLLVASFAPDIIDKTGYMLLGLPGRGMGHSLFVFVLAAITVLIVASRFRLPRGLVSAGLSMWFVHLVGDFPQMSVFLWPLYPAAPEPYPKFDLFQKLHQFYVARMWPEQFWLEMVCIAVAVAILTVRAQSVKTVPNNE
jgi:membrane-bound metal-dependent hydrolase YbcI (DUF457 family)